jgi:maltooligosyltrehalose trehalohydrolase
VTPAGADFRVWADGKRSVTLVLGDGREMPLAADGDGWFAGGVSGLRPGARYGFRVEGGVVLPDPASRRQPDGPEAMSELVGPDAYPWTDAAWRGIGPARQVVYELHIGTFTPEGTWAAAAGRLPHLADLGVTVIEMMPVAEFRGRFGWGYDGALPYAPTSLYGTPDDLRGFIDAAHRHGIGVILDVVYNHFGPGNRLADFSERWFTDRYRTDWGRAPNFDSAGSEAVRDYVAENAAYWIAEFHFDGLRLDAVHAIFDSSPEHIVQRIAREARAAAGARNILLVGEDERQQARFARPETAGGLGLDALWNDDFHHSAQVALTGRREAHYHDHRGAPQEFVAAAKFGHLFQGQRYDWLDAPRGAPSRDLPATAFVNFLENHDQIANSALGQRRHAETGPARLRALTALLLLAPQTPLLFQGQEFWAASPFVFFADQGPELDPLVAEGRADFLGQFASLADQNARARLPRPADPATFARCRLDWSELEARPDVLALHRDLLRLRRDTAAFAAQPSGSRGEIDGAVIGPRAFLLRYFAATPPEQRLLLVNLGPQLNLSSVPDPLYAPPEGTDWHVVWSSEDPAYGGAGRRDLDTSRRITLSADSALVLAPGPPHPPSATDLAAWQASIG